MSDAGVPGATLVVHDLGIMPYERTWEMQKELAARRASGALPNDVLLLVQHPAVITTGRSTKEGHVLTSPAELASHGIALHDVERGGDVTVHEAGQLVMYPILDLTQHTKDLHWYLRQLEATVIAALDAIGFSASRQAGQTGVWIDGRKIASIGVHARDWVTRHGVALNVENDLHTFSHVVPCGIAGVQMTSVRSECARASVAYPGFAEVQAAIVRSFADVFALSPHFSEP
ncbi:MAG: lipoyl(octanoyl) transferase LipB [Gemmatimonadaceae bacterium]|nr:lipoyl(octanoyl) transferase LipB [Gemmatimonadaceae bacterium]